MARIIIAALGNVELTMQVEVLEREADTQEQNRASQKGHRRPYLLDCPFCGSPARLRRCASHQIKIECSSSSCNAAPCVKAPDEQKAVSLWNRRRG